MSDIGERIDDLYDHIDDLCWASRWTDVDAVLLEHAAERDLRVRITLLVATLACRSHLTLRGLYAEATYEWALQQHPAEEAEAIVAGLWPEREGR